MDQGTNMNVPQPAQLQNSAGVSGPSSVSPQENSRIIKIRSATRTKICEILQGKLRVKTDAASKEKFINLVKGIDNRLMNSAKSEAEYSYEGDLESRVIAIVKEHIRQKSRLGAGATPTSVGMNVSHGMGQTSIASANNNSEGATFQSPNSFMNGGPLFNGCQPGFPNSSDVGKVSAIGSDLQRQETAVANNYIPRNLNHQMVDGYRPNVQHGISTPLTTTPLGVRRNTVPLANRPLLQPAHHIRSNLANYFSFPNADSFASSNRYGVVTSSGSMTLAQDTIPLNPNPMMRVNATFSTNHPNLQGMQQTPLPQVLNRQGFHQQARDMEHQGQRSQQLYQLQKQDRLLYENAFRTQLPTPGLATSVKHEPNVDFNKEAPQQQATNGFIPSKLQYQHNPVKDHYIGDQSTSVHSSQMNPSPSFQPQPLQKQSAASVVVQRQSSLQNSTQIPEKNDGERKHIGANSCQRTPMQPEAIKRCSSARPPISIQTVSPGITAERKHLPDGNNNTSSKQVNGDVINQRRWLLFMFHARDCTAAEDECKSKFCFRAKKLLKHIQRCKVPDCTYQMCPQTRKLILHYKECRNKSCPVCVFVKDFKKKHKVKPLRIRGVKCSSVSSKCQPKESSESKQAYNKRGAEAQSANDDLQPSIKRLKTDQHSQNATPETKSNSVPGRGVVCKPHSSMDNQKKVGLKSDPCKNVRVEVKPMDTDVSVASRIPVTREPEKHVAEVAPKCKNEMNAPKEENVKQSVDASKMEISSLVELFTPEQVKEHIHSLRQWVGQTKTKADKNKAMEHYMSVNSCQLCAVERLVYEPIPVYCSPCGARIKRNIFHYSVAAGETRYFVCTPCYNQTREDYISIDGNSIPKARLEKKKNDEQVEEGWVQCDKCQAWQHQICALFNGRRNHGEATKYTCPKCYIEEVEQGERRPLSQSVIPGAKSLPVTTLSNHIEQRLFRKLKKERQERARLQGKSYEEVPGAESLTVRVVASVDKVLEVKQRFFELFREENYPSEFPYKSKAILLFQKIESVEVCLFGMFVQEFGTKSGPPNQRRVYISYLDSVKYFRPEVRTVSGEALRTYVYHEILIGYLDYCKKRGFTSCYIWACPPLKGEDYILNCHPEIQKMPKTDKLREWYLAMLRKASKEDVVVECTNFYDHFFVQSGECRANVTAARLPYFDGDYWPGAAEDLLRQMNQEDDATKLNAKGLTKKVTISKRAIRAVGHLDLPVNASKDRLMMEKLGEIICPMKEDFIMVHLQHCCKHCRTLMVSGNRWVCNQCTNFQICDKCNEEEQRRVDKERHPIYQKEKHSLVPVAIKNVPTEIEDKDVNLESEFFDNRQAFLSLCQGNNYQYDTLRRAKHSSMMVLYHLHNPTAPAFATICAICQLEIENAQGWHCEVCLVYDVCNACYSKAPINHPHKLINRASNTDTVVQQNGQANQRYQIQLEKLKELLVHTTTCRSSQCKFQGCHMMKMCFRHCIGCKIGPGGCGNCDKFWKLIRCHAQSCRDSKCTVPKCRDFRAIISRQQQHSDERRRAAVMNMMRQRAAEVNRTS